MYVFTRMCGSLICHLPDCTKLISAGALIHWQQTIYWLFTQTKLSNIYRHKPIVTYIGLWWNVKRYLQFRRNSNLEFLFLLFGREDSGEILASVWQEEAENFEVLKRRYIQVYPTRFLLRYGKAKAFNFLHLWNLEWSYVKFLKKKQRNTTWPVIWSGTYLNSTLSCFTQTRVAYDKKTLAKFQKT